MDYFGIQQAEMDTLIAIYGEDNILTNIQKFPTIRATLEIPCHLQPPQIIRILTKKIVHTSENCEKLKFDFLATEFCLSYLPSLYLDFTFPPSYPSKDPPAFRLTCNWLNFSQLSTLCHKLDTIWFQNQGRTILFDWFQFLSEELFQFLNIKFPYTLNMESPKHSHDKRAIQDAVSSSDLLETVQSFNSHKLHQIFTQNCHYCCICMNTYIGSSCLQIQPCLHVFCKMCLSKYLKIRIQDSAIANLSCPQNNCESLLTEQIVSQTVNKDVYAKYDELLYKQAIESMDDIVYCPLICCGSPSEIQLADKSMAICLVCKYCFCPKCRHVFHGISKCILDISKFKDIIREYTNANSKEKSVLERKYGKSVLHQMSADIDNHQWIEDNTKKCPNCHIHIEKIFGCSKVLCSHCATHFCWLCHRILPSENPYAHYADPLLGGDCVNKLFYGITLEEFEAWRFELDWA